MRPSPFLLEVEQITRIRGSPSLAVRTSSPAMPPKIRKSPSLGHSASPKMIRGSPSIMQQISADLARSAAIGRVKSASPARPPLGRIDSPNSFDASDDEAVPTLAGRSLKRFRSFGSMSALNPRRATSTPSPLHFATKPRRAAPSPRGGDSPARPKAAWGSAAIDISDGAPRPPPIITSVSLQSLEDWDALEAAVPEPPSNTLASVEPLPANFGAPPLAHGAWRPPPIVRPASIEAPVHAIAIPPVLALIAEDGEASPRSHILPPPPPTPTGRSRDASGFDFGYARPPVPDMSLVAPNLYVGNEEAAASLPELLSAGVTHILNCTNLRYSHAGAAPPFEVMQLGLLDNSSDLPRMHSALTSGVEFIASALDNGGTVLVHCRAGISRSATLAIAYLVRATQQPVDVVFEKVRVARPSVDPNLGYILALHEWEKRVLLSPQTQRGAAGASPRATPTSGMSPPPPRVGVRPLSRAG